MRSTSTTVVCDDLLQQINNPRTRDSAFSAFYDALSKLVYVYALRMTNCADDAADITQETFIRVHTYLVRGNHIQDPLPFCLMIARQRVLNLKRDRKPTVQIEEHHSVLDPYQNIEHAEIQQRIDEAVAVLPLLLRDAFVLRYYDGLPYQTIATLISESSGTVRMRVQRAKALVRKQLLPLMKQVL